MAKTKNNAEVKRINANIPIKLANKVEEYAKDNMLNLTSAYITLLNQALNQYEMMKAMPMYMQLLQNNNLSKVIQTSFAIDNAELIKANEFISKLTPDQINKMIENNDKKD